MDEQKSRKHPRLKEFDYSSNRAYFVTICTDGKRHQLSEIELPTVGRGLAPAEIRLSPWGKIVERQIMDLEDRFRHIKIDKYVIMPNHVHLIIILDVPTAGASPRPTVSDVICAWKSLSTRQCKQNGLVGKLWQNSFYDHIIRDEQDYLTRWQYIDNNPAKWAEDEYYL